MKQAWLNLERKFAKLAKRERTIVFVGGFAAILLLGFQLVDMSHAKQRILNKQLGQLRSETTAAHAQIGELGRQLAQNPDTFARGKIGALRSEISLLDSQFDDIHRGLVSPERMAGVLEDMLTRDRHVRLLALKTLPVTTLTGGNPAEDDRAGVFRHGVEITLEGGYLDLLDYLARLERLPWQMFWATAKMDASAYPGVQLTVVLYTLSLDKKWMVV